MSYSIVGYGATYSAPVGSKLATRMALVTRRDPSSGGTSTTPGMMDPGQITPERCKAAGWWWDEAAQQCLQQAPAEPPPQPDPTVPPSPGPPPPLYPLTPPEPSREQLCAEAGGCWDPMQMECFECVVMGDEPADLPADEPVTEPPEEEDNTAMCIGLALLGAAALAGGWFLISRKKKKGKA
jgi:hypothetical protein